MSDKGESSLYRIACRIVGTSLVLLGGSALFEDLNNSSYGILNKETDPEEIPLSVSAYQIFGNALSVSTGISVWLALAKNSRSVLQGSACLTMTLGVYPVFYELQILSLERSVSEIILAFFTYSVFLHVSGAYFLWRYTDVLSYEEEQRELRRTKKLWKKYGGDPKSSKSQDSKPNQQGTTTSSETSHPKRPRRTRSSLNAPTSGDHNLPPSKFRQNLQSNISTEVPTTLRTSKRTTDGELRTLEEEEENSAESMTEEDANELRQLIEVLRLKQGRTINSTTDDPTKHHHSKPSPRGPTSRSASESTKIKEQTDELSSKNMRSIPRDSGKSKVPKTLRTPKDYNPSKWSF